MVEILAMVGWCAICLLTGAFAGELGRYLAASMALAANEAVTLGVCIGLVCGFVLKGLAQTVRSFID